MSSFNEWLDTKWVKPPPHDDSLREAYSAGMERAAEIAKRYYSRANPHRYEYTRNIQQTILHEIKGLT